MIRFWRWIAVGLSCLVASAGTLAAPTTALPIKHMVVLGDSLSDQGNLFAATSVLGPLFGLPPIPGADHYAAGRFSNGENYAGLLAGRLGIALSASQLGGTNYAFGGSRTDYNVVELRPGVPPPLQNGLYPIGAYPWSLDRQREAFVAAAGKRGADPTGLYVVFSGSNDLSDALTAALFLGIPPDAAIQKAVAGVANVVVAFRDAGARNVLVLNMPNLGLVPSVTQHGLPAMQAASALSWQFNLALDQALAGVGGLNLVRFDTFGVMTDVITHPASYGFTNVTQPCFSGFVNPDPDASVCDTPDTYAFWDSEHPTTRLHAVLANLLYEAVLDCTQHGASHARAACRVNGH
jgi:phospholipase/lecithinase/hemolysin